MNKMPNTILSKILKYTTYMTAKYTYHLIIRKAHKQYDSVKNKIDIAICVNNDDEFVNYVKKKISDEEEEYKEESFCYYFHYLSSFDLWNYDDVYMNTYYRELQSVTYSMHNYSWKNLSNLLNKMENKQIMKFFRTILTEICDDENQIIYIELTRIENKDVIGR